MSVDRKNERHVMLDLETLGTASNSVIISIGAVAFYPYRLIEMQSDSHSFTAFFTAVTEQSCLDAGLVIDEQTKIWWSKQPEEARSQFKDPISLSLALTALSRFINGCDALWGNGSDFDNVILSNAYKACGFRQPWSHRVNRCYRTMKAMFPSIKTIRHELAHHALEDAKYQARHLINTLKEISQ